MSELCRFRLGSSILYDISGGSNASAVLLFGPGEIVFLPMVAQFKFCMCATYGRPQRSSNARGKTMTEPLGNLLFGN